MLCESLLLVNLVCVCVAGETGEEFFFWLLIIGPKGTEDSVSLETKRRGLAPAAVAPVLEVWGVEALFDVAEGSELSLTFLEEIEVNLDSGASNFFFFASMN